MEKVDLVSITVNGPRLTLRCSGFNCAPLYPIAAIILPQFGSSPKIAVFTKFEPMMDLATFFASSHEDAPCTCTSINFVAPSPSLAICFAKERHTHF